MSSPGAPFRDNPETGAPEPNGIDNDFQVSGDPLFMAFGTFSCLESSVFSHSRVFVYISTADPHF